MHGDGAQVRFRVRFVEVPELEVLAPIGRPLRNHAVERDQYLHTVRANTESFQHDEATLITVTISNRNRTLF
jgi:hypothetical protein